MLKYLIPIALATLSVPQLALAQNAAASAQATAAAERARWSAAREARREPARTSREFRAERHDGGRFVAASSGSIDARQARQSEAIARGIESGRLTPREAERLRAEQARIERHEHRARADGRFTPRERARIQHELDRSQRHLSRDLHDRQRVGVHPQGHRYDTSPRWDRSHRYGERSHARHVAFRGDGRHFWR